MSNTTARSASVEKLQRIKVQGYNVPTSLKCEMFDRGRIYFLHILQKMLKMPSMGMNICVSMMPE
jgi:hypothetical protein